MSKIDLKKNNFHEISDLTACNCFFNLHHELCPINRVLYSQTSIQNFAKARDCLSNLAEWLPIKFGQTCLLQSFSCPTHVNKVIIWLETNIFVGL